MFDSILVDDGQKNVLIALVEAVRRAPNDKTFFAAHFMSSDPRAMIMHPGFPEGFMAHIEDVEILADSDLVHLTRNASGGSCSTQTAQS